MGRAGAARVWICDVSDLDSVRGFCTAFLAADIPLHALVHNAGALPATRTESAQGHEMTMALHVLGPVLMTELLLPLLSADEGRVVFVTSGGMYSQALPVDDPEFLRGEYAGATAYARSKRGQIELLPVLSDRWRAAGVTVHATHPGWASTPGVQTSLPRFATLLGPSLRTAGEGADTTTWVVATRAGTGIRPALARPSGPPDEHHAPHAAVGGRSAALLAVGPRGHRRLTGTTLRWGARGAEDRALDPPAG